MHANSNKHNVNWLWNGDDSIRKLTFKNSRGESIEFYLSPFLIDSLTGIGEVDADIQSQMSPYQDGDDYIDTLLQARFINLEGTIIETDLNKIKDFRREISRICNPKLGPGKITFEMDGSIQEIEGTLDGGVVYPERGEDMWQQFSITWKCPDPYWKSLIIQEEPMAAFVPLFELPFEDEFEIGMEGHETIITNNSDVEVPVEIEIKGPSLNPCLTHLDTGEFIRVNRELSSTDLLYINTKNGNKQVLLNGENGFHWLDINSTFFKLLIGENILKYTADSGTDEATLNIKLQEHYNAV